jgi:predicted MFS family arabinose efflux permease
MQHVVLEEGGSLLQNRPFTLLWAAQALTQTAQNALFFTLMVFITEITGSAAQLSLLVFSTILPSLLFGLTAGVVVDRHSKGTVLLVTNILRVVLMVGLLAAGENLALIYVVNFAFSSVSQFFAPAEAASIPFLVPKRQLMAANGLFNLTFTASQFAGLVFPMPVLVKLLGPQAVLMVIAVIYVAASFLVAFLPRDMVSTQHVEAKGFLEGIWEELIRGWQLIRSSPIISLSIMHLTTATTLILVMSVISAPFVKRVLGIRADDAVYILAPAGIGVVLGAILSSRLAQWVPRFHMINASLVVMAICLVAFGSVETLGRYLALGLPGWAVIQWLLLIVVLLAFILGLGFAFVTIPAQTTLQERSPPAMRGKVFATQLTLGNVASILPVAFVGGVADLFGIARVIILVGLAVLAIGIFSLRRSRRLTLHPLD